MPSFVSVHTGKKFAESNKTFLSRPAHTETAIFETSSSVPRRENSNRFVYTLNTIIYFNFPGAVTRRSQTKSEPGKPTM